MQTKQLLTASLLDILFEGRNKEYGAYCLRKEYNKRLTYAMIGTGLTTLLFALIFFLNSHSKENSFTRPVIDTIVMSLPPVDDQPKPLPIPPPAATPANVASFKFTSPPVIVQADYISPDDVPPAVEDIIGRIDVVNMQGDPSDLNGPPGPVGPLGSGNGIIDNLNVQRNNEDSIHIHVEIESSYPGGPKAWSRFLNKNFIYPQNAADNRIEGLVLVKFVVDASGNVSQVEAVSGPPELRNEAVRVIIKSGKWNPAIQNGRHVKSFKKQPIVFKIWPE